MLELFPVSDDFLVLQEHDENNRFKGSLVRFSSQGCTDIDILENENNNEKLFIKSLMERYIFSI